MNYGTLTRIITVLTGVIIIIVLPLALPDAELQKFFIMYSLLPVVALVDFGLIARILATRVVENLLRRTLVLMILLRLGLLIIITHMFVAYFQLADYKTYFILQCAFAIFYLGNIFNAVIEAFDSYRNSYKLKFYSELILVFTLVILCIQRIEDAWVFIIAILFIRSAVIVSYFSIYARRILVSKTTEVEKSHQILEKLTFRVGVVSGLGYLSGHATNWLVALNFSVSESLSYSQSFYAISTLHSLIMSYLIYYQVSFKSTRRIYDTYIIVRNRYLSTLVISFGILSMISFFILKFIGIFTETIKIDDMIFISLFFYFLPIIYNHLVAIVYRINGVELLYYLSIFGSITIISTFYVLGKFYDLQDVLLVNIVISICVNIGFTKMIVLRKGYHV